MKNIYRFNARKFVIVVLFLCSVFYGQAQQSFSLKGLASDTAGIILNNLYSDNFLQTGPAIPSPYNISDSTVAGFINGNSQINEEQRKAFTVEKINLFTSFSAALASNNFNKSDIVLSFSYGIFDNYSQNWIITNNVETRKYEVNMGIFVNNTQIAFIQFNNFKARINYNNPYNANDDKITFESEFGFVQKIPNADSISQILSAALLEDINSKGVKLQVNQMQFSKSVEIPGPYSSILIGKLYEVTDAKLIVGTECPINANFTAQVNYSPNYGKNWVFNIDNINSNLYDIYIDYGDSIGYDTLFFQNYQYQQFTHTYPDFGIKTITVRVEDKNNSSCVKTITELINVVPICHEYSFTKYLSNCNFYNFNISQITTPKSKAAGDYKVNWDLGGTIYNDTNTYNYYPANFAMNYTIPGPKNIVVTVYDQYMPSCVVTFKDSIYIYPALTIDTVLKTSLGDSRFLFDVNTSGGSGNFSYNWTFENRILEIYNDSIYYAYSSLGQKNNSLTVRDFNTNCIASKIEMINISNVSNNTTTAYIGINPIGFNCGKNINFKYYAIDGIFYYSKAEFDWDNNGVVDSTIGYCMFSDNLISHEYPSAGFYTARIKVTSNENPSNFSEYTTSFIVYDDMNLSYEVVQNNAYEVNLIGSVVGGKGPFEYSWTIEGKSYKGENIKIPLTVFREYFGNLKVVDMGNKGCDKEGSVFFEFKDFDNNNCVAMYSYSKDNLNERKLYFVNYSNSYMQSDPTKIQYYWDFNDGSYSSLMNPEHTFAKNGNYNVKLSINDGFGCVKFYETSIVIGSTTNCFAAFDYTVNMANNTVTFENLSSSYPNGCMWYFGNGTVSTQTNPTYTYTSSGIYNVGLMVNNQAQQCMDYAEKTIEVGVIDNNCKADFIFYNDIATKKVYFANTSTGTANNYYWNFGDGDSSSQANPIHQYANPGYYDVCLNIWNSATNCWNMNCKSVVAGNSTASSLASFTYMSNFATKTVNFTNKTIGNYTESNWDFGDGTSSTITNPTHTYTNAGMYLVSLKVKNSFNLYSYYYNIVTLDLAHTGIYGDFGYVLGQGMGKAAGKVDFKGTTFGDISKVIWGFGDGDSDSTSINITHEYEQLGNYNVCITMVNQNGGTFNKCKTVNIVSRINENTKLDFNIFPNPANEELFVYYNLANEGNIEIEIYNALGNKVLNKENVSTKGVFKSKINVSSLTQGVYFVKIKTDKGVGVQKFIINK